MQINAELICMNALPPKTLVGLPSRLAPVLCVVLPDGRRVFEEESVQCML